MTQVQTETRCANCDRVIKLNPDILESGCPDCGSFKFITKRILTDLEKQQKEVKVLIDKEMREEDITKDISSIRLSTEGAFEIDLEKLLEEVTENKPIITRNKDGTYHVKFPEKK